MLNKINATGKINVGDVIVNSWGYDQTNIDYFQVISKSKKTIKICRIKSNENETGFMSGKSVPILNNFVGDEMRKVPYEYSEDSCLAGNIYVNFEYGCGKIWNGKPESYTSYA